MSYTGLFIFFNITLLVSAMNLDYLDPTKLQTRTSPEVQAAAALRIISKYASNVTVKVDPVLFHDKRDAAMLHATNGQLQIHASSGVAAVWGFHYYFKKYCRGHVGWQVSRTPVIHLPDAKETVEAADRFRYYQNVCTVSYSFVWWDAAQWLKHVEWMALNGINLALAPVAQEDAWARVYRRLGLTQAEIDQHFTGPAFLSWFRMGNLRGWGGPLLQSWTDRQRVLQHAVVESMLQLGMIPVLPAFSGFVPKAFTRIFPEHKFLKVNTWCGFNSTYCCPLFINPSDPLFVTVGKMFLSEITANSTGHIYNGDSFNEIRVSPWNTEVVAGTAKAMFKAMTEVDDKAVWLIQNWIFVNDAYGWPKERVKAYLTAVPIGRLLILDLYSEQLPKFQKFNMYFGQPFIWCMLHNSGGSMGMYGNTMTISRDVYEARTLPNNTMIGIGLTPEGINTNYVLYDLMMEAAWRKQPVLDLEAWSVEYAQRRYGCDQLSDAWRHLMRSVYNYTPSDPLDQKFLVTAQPRFNRNPQHWYKESDLFEAFKLFVTIPNGKCNSAGFMFDLVDVTRQALQHRVDQIYNKLKHDFSHSNVATFNTTVNIFLDLYNDLTSILATHDAFYGKIWREQARSMSSDPKEQDVYEFYARTQVTLWGPNGEIRDYACRQWAELLHYYYRPRWQEFLSAAMDAKVSNTKFDEGKVLNKIFHDIELKFARAKLLDIPRGDPRTVAFKLYKKWGKYNNIDELSDN